jgi:predicted DNA-binding transcriptional regulator YafY
MEYDPECFSILLHAVTNRHRLRMVYWTASRNDITERVFDPYELTLMDDGFYVFGHCHRARKIRQFAVQRVRSVKETGETFDRPADFSVESHMRDAFRALRGDGDHDVVLRFGRSVSCLIAEKAWHASQVLEREADGHLIVRLHVTMVHLSLRPWARAGFDLGVMWDSIARPAR